MRWRITDWTKSWKLDSAAKWAEIIEAAAVTGALLVAGIEYYSHHTAERLRKKEAVSAILQRAFAPEGVDEAFGKLYRKYANDCTMPQCNAEFDNDTGTLTGYFWAVERCADGIFAISKPS